jgi:UDP-3-O-[3-hydroxymyristoyl] glucosamine N-acyltransferase
MERKYKLTSEFIIYDDTKLYRIQALVDMPMHNVKAGDLGGYIESYENLQGDAWVGDNAKVWDQGLVRHNAHVYGNAEVRFKSQVSYDAKVYDNAVICSGSVVSENAEVYGDALIEEGATVYGNAKVYGDARVGAYARIYGNTKICGSAHIRENVFIQTGTITKTGQVSTFRVGEGYHVTVTPEHAIIDGESRTHEECLNYFETTEKHKELRNIYSSILKIIINRK